MICHCLKRRFKASFDKVSDGYLFSENRRKKNKKIKFNRALLGFDGSRERNKIYVLARLDLSMAGPWAEEMLFFSVRPAFKFSLRNSLDNYGLQSTTVVTSRIFRSAGAQSFRGAHRGRVCVRAFTGVSVRACCKRLCCTVSI
jgi:hypothetical protein